MTRGLWLLLTTALLCGQTLAADAGRPNVILIMADDFGYECVTANGGQSYKTPNLDRLAATGMRFEHCYVQPLCTPTRVQLMTGIYRHGQLHRLSGDPYEEQLIAKADYSPADADAARTLQVALDQYANARPAELAATNPPAKNEAKKAAKNKKKAKRNGKNAKNAKQEDK